MIIRNQRMSAGFSGTSVAAIKQHVFTQHKKTGKKKGIRLTTLGSYAGIFLLIITLVAIGYAPPKKVDQAAGVANATGFSTLEQPSVDQLVAATITSELAERAHLPIAPNVSELSVTLAVKNELAQTDDTTITKPQIVEPTTGSREIKTYTAKTGDSVPEVAKRFGILPETVKWANDLTSDALEPGKRLTIPPVDGVIYQVRAGDTLASLASRYRTNESRIVAFNDLEVSGLKPNKKIIIPGGSPPSTERPGYVAPRQSYGSGGYSANTSLASSSVGNRYAYGWCTWYAYERRAQLGRPIGSFWGNASTWAANAMAAGLAVDGRPEPGAIMQNGGGWGHVAVVESVDAAGNVTVSEMNYVGWNVISSRTISAGQAAGYSFIH